MHNLLLCAKTCMFKRKAFSILLAIRHLAVCINSVVLKEWGKEEKVFHSTEATLPSEERILLQFHIQAFSSAHQCL